MHDSGWTGAFEQWAEAFMASRQIPGISVAVGRDGREIYSRGFGFADRESGRPITPDTVYGIGSITKSFTCAAIMQLAEQGRLRLDVPVVEYVPELVLVFGDRSGETTLHHLMTHTTGMPPLPVLMAALRRSMDADPDAAEELPKIEALGLGQVNTYAEHIELLSRLPFPWLGDPGRFFSYSNDCFGLLGLVIERVSGVPYESYVEKHLLEPMGMNRSVFDHRGLAALGDVGTLYVRRAVKDAEGRPVKDGDETRTDVVRAPVWWEAPAQTAAGFLKASARDMLRYLELYRNAGVVGTHRILSEDSVARMVDPAFTLHPGFSYGYGLGISQHHGMRLIGHSGGLKGISAYVTTEPERGLSVVVLIPLGGEASGRVAMAALNTMIGLDPDYVEPVAQGPQPADPAPYTGRFHSGEAMEDAEVVAEDGQLYLVLDDKRRAMRDVGDGYFVVGEDSERMWLRAQRRDGGVFSLLVGSRSLPRRELWDEVGYPALRPAAAARPGSGR